MEKETYRREEIQRMFDDMYGGACDVCKFSGVCQKKIVSYGNELVYPQCWDDIYQCFDYDDMSQFYNDNY